MATAELDNSNIGERYFQKLSDSKSFLEIIDLVRDMCSQLGVDFNQYEGLYKDLKEKLTTWRWKELWKLFDKRASQEEYKQQTSCRGMKCLVIGAGPVGLRAAIEAALLGAQVDVVEKRDSFSRNNVLHLWPFLITDLRNLGAKKFYGRFCSSDLDHISIRMLQYVLLKTALLLGVKVHPAVEFLKVVEPSSGRGWRAEVKPNSCPVTNSCYDIMIGADGKKYVLPGFRTKEFRPRLAIAITANFVNQGTQKEAQISEISGIAYVYHQAFFNEMRDKHGIELENVVYYKDETHYFVMTAKKQSLLKRGVLKQDFPDASQLLSSGNVCQSALKEYAKDVASFSTKGGFKVEELTFQKDYRGRDDVALFDFTSLFAAENSARIVERKNKRVLMCLVGDSLIEPFWPTGSGLARGYLGVFDAAWMMKGFGEGRPPMELIEERESILQLLSQTTPNRVNCNFEKYTIDPSTRYLDIKDLVPLNDVSHLHDVGQGPQLPTEVIRSGIKSTPKKSQKKNAPVSRKRYSTISGLKSSRDSDTSDKMNLEDLKNWKITGKPYSSGSDNQTKADDKAKTEAEKPQTGHRSPHPSPQVGKETEVKSSNSPKWFQGSPKQKPKEISNQKDKPTMTKPENEMVPNSDNTSEEKPSQPKSKKGFSLFSSLLRPSSPKKRPASPKKRPASPKKRPASPKKRPASPKKRPASPKHTEVSTKKVPESQLIGSPKTAKSRPSSAKSKQSEGKSKKSKSSGFFRRGKSYNEEKGQEMTKTAGHFQVCEYEASPQIGTVRRTQSMQAMNVGSAISFYENMSSGTKLKGTNESPSKQATSSPKSRKSPKRHHKKSKKSAKENVDFSAVGNEQSSFRKTQSMYDLSYSSNDSFRSTSNSSSFTSKEGTSPSIEGSITSKDSTSAPREEATSKESTSASERSTSEEYSATIEDSEKGTVTMATNMATQQSSEKRKTRPKTWALDDIPEIEPTAPSRSLSNRTIKDSEDVKGSTVTNAAVNNTEGGTAKSPEPLWLAKYIASLNSCLDKLRKSCDIIEAKTALEILKTITKNVEEHPEEDTYRRVRVSSSSFFEKVWQLENCKRFLVLSGWIEIEDVIVAPIGKSLALPLRTILKHLGIVDNKIWSMQIELPQPKETVKRRRGSLKRQESYATSVVNDAMDKVAMAALKMRKTPSPHPITESEECDSPYLSKVSMEDKKRAEEVQIMKAARSARKQVLEKLKESEFNKPEVEWKPFLEAELYSDYSSVPAWRRRNSLKASSPLKAEPKQDVTISRPIDSVTTVTDSTPPQIVPLHKLDTFESQIKVSPEEGETIMDSKSNELEIVQSQQVDAEILNKETSNDTDTALQALTSVTPTHQPASITGNMNSNNNKHAILEPIVHQLTSETSVPDSPAEENNSSPSKDALSSSLPKDTSLKALSIESLRSFSEDEDFLVGKLVISSANTPVKQNEDDVFTEGEPTKSVAYLRDLWMKRSSSSDVIFGTVSPTKTPPASVSSDITEVEVKQTENTKHTLTRSLTVPSIPSVKASDVECKSYEDSARESSESTAAEVETSESSRKSSTNSLSQEASNITKQSSPFPVSQSIPINLSKSSPRPAHIEEEKMVLEAGRIAHELAKTIFSKSNY